MSLESLLIHTAAARVMAPAAPAERDIFGNRELGPVAGSGAVVYRARFELTDADENINDRDLQRERYLVFLEPAADGLDGNDELLWVEEDRLCRLEGAPLPIYDAIGLHHLEVIAYRTTPA